MFRALDNFFSGRNAVRYILTAIWVILAVRAFIYGLWFSFFINVLLIVAFNYKGIKNWTLTKKYQIKYRFRKKEPKEPDKPLYW